MSDDLPSNIDMDPGGGYVKDGFRIAPKARNFVRFMWYDTCSRPFWVYLLTAVPAIIEASITLRIYDLEDIIRDEAKILAGEPPDRGRRKKRHSKIGRVPAKQPPLEKFSQKGLGHLLVWTEPLERLGFALLMYGAVDQFFFRWQSLITAVSPCVGQGGVFARHAKNTPWGQLSGGAAVSMPFLDQNTAAWTTSGFSVNVPAGKYGIHMAATVKSTGGATFNTGIRILIPGIFGTEIVESGLQEISGQDSKSFVISKTSFISGFAGGNIGWQTYGDTVPTGLIALSARIFVGQDIEGVG